MNTQDAIGVAVFGVEAERFITSEIGQYLVNRAENDRNKAIEEFKTVDPTNQAEVQRIQNDLNTPDRVMKWLTDAIQSGYAAHDALRAAEAENGEL